MHAHQANSAITLPWITTSISAKLYAHVHSAPTKLVQMSLWTKFDIWLQNVNNSFFFFSFKDIHSSFTREKKGKNSYHPLQCDTQLQHNMETSYKLVPIKQLNIIIIYNRYPYCTLRTPWWNCYRTATASELLWSRRNVTGGAFQTDANLVNHRHRTRLLADCQWCCWWRCGLGRLRNTRSLTKTIPRDKRKLIKLMLRKCTFLPPHSQLIGQFVKRHLVTIRREQHALAQWLRQYFCQDHGVCSVPILMLNTFFSWQAGLAFLKCKEFWSYVHYL